MTELVYGLFPTRRLPPRVRLPDQSESTSIYTIRVFVYSSSKASSRRRTASDPRAYNWRRDAVRRREVVDILQAKGKVRRVLDSWQSIRALIQIPPSSKVTFVAVVSRRRADLDDPARHGRIRSPDPESSLSLPVKSRSSWLPDKIKSYLVSYLTETYDLTYRDTIRRRNRRRRTSTTLLRFLPLRRLDDSG